MRDIRDAVRIKSMRKTRVLITYTNEASSEVITTASR